ncbi:MAG: glutamine amidotransferase, partial [Elusimicrobiota bacterium]
GSTAPLAVRDFGVEVIRQKYRIMYLSGRPSYGYASLREFMKTDPNHELVSFVILRNPENPSPASDRELSLIPFPMDEIFSRTLPQFDLFILENFSAARFNMPPAYLENLRRFVFAGGALLVKGGENAFASGGYKGSPLEDALPVVLSGRSPDFIPGLFAPKLPSYEHPLVKLFETPTQSRRAWDALPDLDGWGRFAGTRPGAQIVASHPTQAAEDGTPLAVIAAHSYGRGKVMLISTDSTWRWKLGAVGDRLASGVYERFWTRAVQYLTGTLDLSKVKFAPLPDRIVPREPFSVGLRVFDEDFSPAQSGETRLSVVWTKPDGRFEEVAARETSSGIYAVELTGLEPGTHRLQADARVRGRAWGADEKRFVWEQVVDAPMDRAWLSKTAELGGGGFFELSRASASELLERLPPPRAEAETVRRLRPFLSPLWLALCGIILLSEWAWRRRSGHI